MHLKVGALLSSVGGLCLLVLMFSTRWYGVVGLPHSADRSGIQTAAGPWHELTLLRWLMLATGIVAVGSSVLHFTQRAHGNRTDTSPAIAVLGSLTSLGLIYRVLIDPPSPNSVVDVKLGAFLALLSALAVALGGIESFRESRERRRRVARRARPPGHVASGSAER
jgi:hypothetical protein